MGLGGALGSIFGKAIEPITDIIGKAVVDKDKARELNVRLEELADKADERLHLETMGQIETNQIEAQHSSIFVAGWRPFAGWVSGVGLAFATLILPLISWVAVVIFGYTGTFPEFDTMLLVTVLGGMLGLSTNRMFEKRWDVARDSMQTK